MASLRKLKKAMNDRRIEIKKTFMAPYTNFEAQVKELDKLIDGTDRLYQGRSRSLSVARGSKESDDL